MGHRIDSNEMNILHHSQIYTNLLKPALPAAGYLKENNRT